MKLEIKDGELVLEEGKSQLLNVELYGRSNGIMAANFTLTDRSVLREKETSLE